jgi:hypothetical protein
LNKLLRFATTHTTNPLYAFLAYRFHFNGQEADNEVAGSGNIYSFQFRTNDVRLGKFLSVDPLEKEYPWNSPYAFAENRVIDGKELEGLEYQNANGVGLGPLSEQGAKDRGATLEPGFQNANPNELPTPSKPTNTPVSNLPSSTSPPQSTNLVSPSIMNLTSGLPTGKPNNAVIKPYNILNFRPDIAMSLQIGQGVAIGLSGEIAGLGVTKMLGQIGQLPVPLYRTFGGEARSAGVYYTPINPAFFGKNYPRFAGLPVENSAAFTVRVSTPINNLNFSSFGFAQPIGVNGGRVVPEIQVFNVDAVRVSTFKVNSFTNPAYKPILPVNF